MLGDMSLIDEKMMRLKSIAPSLEDKKGILHLENIKDNPDDDYVTYESD